MALHFEDPVDRRRREEPDAIDFAAAGHRRLEARNERALPWPLAAPMSARRQPSVQVVSGVMTGLLVDLNATLFGSSSGESFGGAGGAGGGTTLATRWNSEGDRPMWKSAPSGRARCAAKNSPRRWPVMRRITSPIKWP